MISEIIWDNLLQKAMYVDVLGENNDELVDLRIPIVIMRNRMGLYNHTSRDLHTRSFHGKHLGQFRWNWRYLIFSQTRDGQY